jgi:hypothetical protein
MMSLPARIAGRLLTPRSFIPDMEFRQC